MAIQLQQQQLLLVILVHLLLEEPPIHIELLQAIQLEKDLQLILL